LSEKERAMELDELAVMKVKDVARYLGVHPTTVYRLLKEGALPAFQVGSDWRFNRESIDEWRRNLEAKIEAIDATSTSGNSTAADADGCSGSRPSELTPFATELHADRYDSMQTCIQALGTHHKMDKTTKQAEEAQSCTGESNAMYGLDEITFERAERL